MTYTRLEILRQGETFVRMMASLMRAVGVPEQARREWLAKERALLQAAESYE
jgi:hypothetical protein